MIKASFLEFHKPDVGYPIASCNTCAEPVGPDCLIAAIPLGADDEYMIVVCSGTCRDKFKFHPNADAYIADGIANVLKARQT